jgi:hypothetical protein
MNMSVAIGSGTPYSVHITQASYKDVGVYNLVGSIIMYMGNNVTLDYPAEIVLSSDKDITVKVIGWAITIHKY